MSNIIIYIKNNIIESSNHKSLNIINKNFLSNNNFVTNCLFDMIFLISKTKDEQITKNYIELLTNIYAFSFRYDNLMVQLLKSIKPLLININQKSINDMDNELNIINVLLYFMKELIKKEEDILKKEILLKEGFFMGDKYCGISSEIDFLEDEFSLMFGFNLYDNKISFNNDKKELSLINIKSKDNISQIKIWLSKVSNSNDEYNLMISDKNKMNNTGIIIKSNSNYIFSFNFIKNTKVTIYYISNDNNNEINKTKDIKLKFNIDNCANIYIGCDIIKEKVVNTFNGYMGAIFLLNNKKLSQKSNENIDLILKLI